MEKTYDEIKKEAFSQVFHCTEEIIKELKSQINDIKITIAKCNWLDNSDLGNKRHEHNIDFKKFGCIKTKEEYEDDLDKMKDELSNYEWLLRGLTDIKRNNTYLED